MLLLLLVCFDSALDNPLDMLNQPQVATFDGAIDVDVDVGGAVGGVDDEDCSVASDTAVGLNHVLRVGVGMRIHGMGCLALVVAAGGWTRYESHVDETLGPDGGSVVR